MIHFIACMRPANFRTSRARSAQAVLHFIARLRTGAVKAWLFLAVLALSGCSVLPESETLVFYRLPSSDSAMSTQLENRAARLPAVLRVATPYGNRAVGSTRILVVPEPERISAYKGARWADAAPVILRDRLVESFREAGVFRSVVTDSDNLNADLELSSDLPRFQVVYQEGAPVVVITLDATISVPASSRIISSRRFHVEQAVQGKEVPEVVQAFGLAVDQLAAQLLDWTGEQTRTVR